MSLNRPDFDGIIAYWPGTFHADLFASGMRLLLSGADHLQIERFSRILFVAGIQSQVRKAPAGRAFAKPASGAELWVEDPFGHIYLSATASISHGEAFKEEHGRNANG